MTFGIDVGHAKVYGQTFGRVQDAMRNFPIEVYDPTVEENRVNLAPCLSPIGCTMNAKEFGDAMRRYETGMHSLMVELASRHRFDLNSLDRPNEQSKVPVVDATIEFLPGGHKILVERIENTASGTCQL